jgi:hypothetical protein
MMTRPEKITRRDCATHISPACSAGGMERDGAALPRRLPVFEGYTVDERLAEFRKLDRGRLPEFVPFSSAKGERLLARYRASMQARE